MTEAETSLTEPSEEELSKAVEEITISTSSSSNNKTMSPTSSVVSLLSEQEQKALEELLQIMESQKESMTTYQKYFVFTAEPDHGCLIRYLRARDFDVEKASKLLKSTLLWLAEYKPQEITAKMLSKEAASGKLFIYEKCDKFNRPVVIMNPGKENTYDNVANIQLLVYTLCSAVSRMPEGVKKMAWICDFEGYSMKNAPSLSVCKQTVEVLSSHFVERLGNAYIINAPRAFSWFFKLISPFIPPVTKEKIKFCYSSNKEDMVKFFEPYFDMDTLPQKYGGNAQFEYDHATFWQEEMKRDDERLKKLANVMDIKNLLNLPQE